MKIRKYHASRLGLSEDAGIKQIRCAFRKQALLRHPDKNGGMLVPRPPRPRARSITALVQGGAARAKRPAGCAQP